MAENTAIEWADATVNFWAGCSKVSPACDHCYAERMAGRLWGVKWGAGEQRLRFEGAAETARALNRKAERTGKRLRVFCNSMSDVFDNEVDPAWRLDLFRLIEKTPSLDWLLLSKRIGNARNQSQHAMGMIGIIHKPLPTNVWIGATICNQEEADRDIPKLLAVPATKRFLSIEPMLGPVDIRWAFADAGVIRCPRCGFCTNRLTHGPCPNDGGTLVNDVGVDWVIVGGESGPKARPMHPDWVRSLRDQCNAAGVPFFFKQWGEHSLAYDRDLVDPDYKRCNEMDQRPGRWINLDGGYGFSGRRVHFAERIGKKAAGRLLDGREWSEGPA